MADTCGIVGFDNIFNNIVLPLSAYATITTSVIIGLSYMAGNTLSNPKLTAWSKTEAVQLFVSAFSVLLLITLMTTFCTINVKELGQLFGILTDDVNIYQAAEKYLTGAALYSHNAITLVRYHMEAYSVLGALNQFHCDFGGLGCLFGYSGISSQPLGGYGADQSALGIFFNTAIFSHFSAMNFLFILLFVYKGFVLLFLPIGIFLRAMPYMRSFGSLLIAVAISFLIVYPFMLSILYLMQSSILDLPFYAPDNLVTYKTVGGNPPKITDIKFKYDEAAFGDPSGGGQSLSAAFFGTEEVIKTYFPNGDNPVGVMAFAAQAFLAGVFFPTAAMLGTLASIGYLARLYGEEIDLSRILQMV